MVILARSQQCSKMADKERHDTERVELVKGSQQPT